MHRRCLVTVHTQTLIHAYYTDELGQANVQGAAKLQVGDGGTME